MTPQDLRELYGQPSEIAARKEAPYLDRHCRDIIAASPFVLIATSDGGALDVSPKGDPAGFVAVEDDRHLVIPDRPGNNRIDGLLNILANPQVALLFMIPSVDETLRVNGTAEIIADPDLCARFAIRGRSPKTVTRVRAEQIFTHCGKALLRAGLWRPDTWPETRPIPTLMEIIRDHADMAIDGTAQSDVDDLYERTLY